MMRVRGGVQRWSAIAVVVLVMVGGCRDQVFDVVLQENESALETYTVTFDRQGGVGGTTSVTVTLGSPMPVGLAPTKAGAVFDGYYARLEMDGTVVLGDLPHLHNYQRFQQTDKPVWRGCRRDLRPASGLEKIFTVCVVND